MILNKEQIKKIITKVKDGVIHITEEESLNLIETMISEIKNVKMGDIESPAFAIQEYGNGIQGQAFAQQRYKMMDFATNKAIGYYINKFNEI